MTQNIKIDPYGFRAYDARWLYEENINKAVVENLGQVLGTQRINDTQYEHESIRYEWRGGGIVGVRKQKESRNIESWKRSRKTNY